MNKILIVYVGLVDSRKIDCQLIFYEALAEYFSSLGHDVLLWNCWYYFSCTADILFSTSDEVDNAVLSQLKYFNPNIILDFNNVLPTPIKDALTARHIVFCADSADYICHKERLRSSPYTQYISCAEGISQQIEKELNAQKENIVTIPCATGIQAREEIQNKNISFLGTNFGAKIYPFSQEISSSYALYRAEPYIKPIIEAIQDNYYITPEEVYTLLNKNEKNVRKEIIYYLIPMLRRALVKEHRIAHLSMISDLGLHLYGPHIDDGDWNELLLYNLELALCYRRKGVYSLRDNELLYNSSYIGLNISHLQAIGGFSWRVADIMASNACIVTEREDVFISLFQDYFTQEQLEVILYTDKYDMREKIKELLRNTPLRASIVEQSQRAIEERYRWNHYTDVLEKAFNTELTLHANSQEGELYYIQHPATMHTPPPSLKLLSTTKIKETKAVCEDEYTSILAMYYIVLIYALFYIQQKESY